MDSRLRGNDKRVSMSQVKAKKHLGQHFLTDESIAKDIADTLGLKGYDNVLEIGPGMGVLTKYLLKNRSPLTLSKSIRNR